MNIKLNGENFQINQNEIMIEKLLKDQSIPIDHIVVELNGDILSDYQVKIKEGDSIEVIRMVGGG